MTYRVIKQQTHVLFGFYLLFFLGCGESENKNKNGVSLPQTQSPLTETEQTPKLFSEKNQIPYRNNSSNQLDTLCVDLSGKNISLLKSELDDHAETIGQSRPEVLFWYEQFLKNDYDYSQWCATSGFPKTFISTRTNVSHTVSNLSQCKGATSNLVSSEYVQYIKNGGAPILISAKIKTTGCSGAPNPFKGRIQSVHGAMIDDYRSIPQSYP